MHHSEGSDPRRSWREDLRGRLLSFPGPIAVACVPPPGARVLVGGEQENGRGFAVGVVYAGPDEHCLLVRTKAAPLPVDPEYPPPFVTVDTLWTAFGIHDQRSGRGTFGGPPPRGMSNDEGRAWNRARIAAMREHERRFLEASRGPVTVTVDGVGLPALRVEFEDRSGVELDWDGETVQCVGEAAVIDVLALRTATEADLV